MLLNFMFLSPPLTLYSCLPSGRGRQVIILDTFIQRNEKSVKGVDKDNQGLYTIHLASLALFSSHIYSSQHSFLPLNSFSVLQSSCRFFYMAVIFSCLQNLKRWAFINSLPLSESLSNLCIHQ